MAVAVFGFVLVENLLGSGFKNDHFAHLSRGAQVLHGELPVRDFYEGLGVLETLSSTLVLAVGGFNLLGEALFCSSALALAAAVAFFLSARATGSVLLGLLLVAPVFVVPVRLYSYPKVLFPVLVLAVLWWCLDRPSSGRLVTLGALIGTTFLFRHDLALYAVPAVTASLALVDWNPRAAARRIATVAAAALLTVLPMLVYVQVTWGLADYVRGTLDVVSAEQTRTGLSGGSEWPRFRGFPLAVADEVARPSTAQINVRYAPGVSPRVRREVELKYGLAAGARLQDDPRGRSWSYRVPAESASFAELVADKRVEDTHGVNRETGELSVSEESKRLPVLGRVGELGVFRLRAPLESAIAWLFYLLLAVPVAVIAVSLAAWRRRWSRHDDPLTPVQTIAAALLALVVSGALLRAPLEVRLQDVIALGMVNLACGLLCIRWALRALRGRLAVRSQYVQKLPLLAAAATVACVWVVTLASAGAISANEGGTLSGRARLYGFPFRPILAARSLAERVAAFREYPPDNEELLEGVSHYVNACTRPADRTFATLLLPELYFYADRAFAGRHVYLLPGYLDGSDAQQATIAEFREHRTPIVVGRRGDTELQHFELLAAFLDENYDIAEWAPGSQYLLYLSRHVQPIGRYRDTSLPCFA